MISEQCALGEHEKCRRSKACMCSCHDREEVSKHEPSIAIRIEEASETSHGSLISIARQLVDGLGLKNEVAKALKEDEEQ